MAQILNAPEPDGSMEFSSDSEHSVMSVVAGDDAYKLEEDGKPASLKKAELNDLTQDLDI